MELAWVAQSRAGSGSVERLAQSLFLKSQLSLPVPLPPKGNSLFGGRGIPGKVDKSGRTLRYAKRATSGVSRSIVRKMR